MLPYTIDVLIAILNFAFQSLLQSRQFDALDERALREEEGDDDRDRKHDRRRHQLIPRDGMLALKILQANRHRVILRASEE